jgi:hypothetical protein
MKRLGLIAALCLIAAGVTVASAEQVGSPDQIVSFDVNIIPSKLPRDQEMPITIRAKGNIKPTAKDRLAKVNSLEIAINRHGRIFTAGLPICHLKQLVATSTKDALAACQAALVGHGRIVVKQVFPEQGVFEIEGALLLFNGRAKGSRAIFLHVHSTNPPSTVIVPFKVSRMHGTFGTLLSASIAQSRNKWLYLTRFEFVIGRRYTYLGNEHGFVQASCPAPHGSDEAIVPFAKITFRFPTTKTLRTTLVRSCHVRNE